MVGQPVPGDRARRLVAGVKTCTSTSRRTSRRESSTTSAWRAADIWIESDVYVELAPSKHNLAQGFFLYGYEPGGNRAEVTSAGPTRVRAGRALRGLGRGRPRKKGQARHKPTVPTFHTYGTPVFEPGNDVSPQAAQAHPGCGRRPGSA